MMKHFLLSALIALMLGGCSSTSPAIQEYTLIPRFAKDEISVPLSVKTLAIMPVKAAPSLSVRDVTYVLAGGETGSYLYARWSDTPANLIGRELVLNLGEKHIFSSLTPASSSARADWTLESDLHAFHHRFLTDTQSEGVFDLTLRVIDAGDRRIIATKRFTIRAEAQTPDSKGAVGALSKTVKEFNNQSSQWLGNIAKECP